MKPKVTVVDYGIGNVGNVIRALEHCGSEVLFTASPEEILGSARVVLPGVGAFADGMKGLSERGLVAPLKEYADLGRPLLGICLGMQMLMDTSEEFGTHEGLRLIPGKVVLIPSTAADGSPHKIPHIGWNKLVLPPGLADWHGTILEGMKTGSYAYFVHSFTAVPADPSHRLADCFYNGRLISAAVRRGSLWGCQFHPEKSGEAGLEIIRRFCRS